MVSAYPGYFLFFVWALRLSAGGKTFALKVKDGALLFSTGPFCVSYL